MKNVTIGGKYVTKYGDNPGPGHYSENHNVVKERVKGHAFANSPSRSPIKHSHIE